MKCSEADRNLLFAVARAADRLHSHVRLGLAFGVDELPLKWLEEAADDIAACIRDLRSLHTIDPAPRERAEVAL